MILNNNNKDLIYSGGTYATDNYSNDIIYLYLLSKEEEVDNIIQDIIISSMCNNPEKQMLKDLKAGDLFKSLGIIVPYPRDIYSNTYNKFLSSPTSTVADINGIKILIPDDTQLRQLYTRLITILRRIHEPLIGLWQIEDARTSQQNREYYKKSNKKTQDYITKIYTERCNFTEFMRLFNKIIQDIGVWFDNIKSDKRELSNKKSLVERTYRGVGSSQYSSIIKYFEREKDNNELIGKPPQQPPPQQPPPQQPRYAWQQQPPPQQRVWPAHVSELYKKLATQPNMHDLLNIFTKDYKITLNFIDLYELESVLEHITFSLCVVIYLISTNKYLQHNVLKVINNNKLSDTNEIYKYFIGIKTHLETATSNNLFYIDMYIKDYTHLQSSYTPLKIHETQEDIVIEHYAFFIIIYLIYNYFYTFNSVQITTHNIDIQVQRINVITNIIYKFKGRFNKFKLKMLQYILMYYKKQETEQYYIEQYNSLYKIVKGAYDDKIHEQYKEQREAAEKEKWRKQEEERRKQEEERRKQEEERQARYEFQRNQYDGRYNQRAYNELYKRREKFKTYRTNIRELIYKIQQEQAAVENIISIFNELYPDNYIYYEPNNIKSIINALITCFQKM